MSKKKDKEILKKYNLEKYLSYATTDEAYAILFVKKYLNQADGMWVNILNTDHPNHYESSNLQFKEVKCELFPRKIKPKYPPKKDFQNDKDYYLVCRAITYDTAHKDIEKQKRKGIKGKRYTIEGIHYFDTKKKRPSYFIDSTPEEIKELEKHLNDNDKTNPLWDEAVKYINQDYYNFNPYSYKIINIKRI